MVEIPLRLDFCNGVYRSSVGVERDPLRAKGLTCFVMVSSYQPPLLADSSI